MVGGYRCRCQGVVSDENYCAPRRPIGGSRLVLGVFLLALLFFGIYFNSFGVTDWLRRHPWYFGQGAYAQAVKLTKGGSIN